MHRFCSTILFKQALSTVWTVVTKTIVMHLPKRKFNLVANAWVLSIDHFDLFHIEMTGMTQSHAEPDTLHAITFVFPNQNCAMEKSTALPLMTKQIAMVSALKLSSNINKC